METSGPVTPGNDNRPADLGRSVATGFLWLYLSYGLIVLSQVVGLVVLARLLGPRDFGLFAIAVLFTEVGRTAFGMGLGPALVQLRGDIDDYVDVAWTANLVVSTLVTLGLAVAVPFVVRGFFREPEAILPAWVLLTAVLLDGFRNPRNAILTRRLDMRRRFWLTAPPTVSRYLVSILCAIFVPSVWALVLGYWFWHLLGLVASYLVMPGRPRFAWSRAQFSELYSFGGWLQLKNVFRWLARNLDGVVVGRVLGAGALGFYNRALALARLPQQQVNSVVDLVAFPMFAALQGGDRGKVRRAFKGSFDATAMIVFPVLVAALLFGRGLVGLLLGTKWLEMTRAFQVLVVAIAVDSLAQSFFPLLRGMGHSKREFWIHGIKLVVVAMLLYPLTRRFGIEGAALAMVVGSLATAPLVLRDAARLAGVGVRDWGGSLMACCLGLLGVWPVAMGVKGWLGSGPASIVVGLPVALSVYLAVLFLLHGCCAVGPAETVLMGLRRLGSRQEGQ